jgi:hypothetical protein
MRKKDIILCLRRLTKWYNLHLTVTKKVPRNIDGYFSFNKCKLFIKSTLTIQNTLITFFHELAHGVAYNNGFWKDFHEGRWGSLDNAYNIEKNIDRIALHLWNKHIEEIPGGRKKWKNFKKTYTEGDRKRINGILEDFFIGHNAQYILTKQQIKEQMNKLMEKIK